MAKTDKMKIQCIDREKIFTNHRIKALYLEHMKNSQNLTVK